MKHFALFLAARCLPAFTVVLMIVSNQRNLFDHTGTGSHRNYSGVFYKIIENNRVRTVYYQPLQQTSCGWRLLAHNFVQWLFRKTNNFNTGNSITKLDTRLQEKASNLTVLNTQDFRFCYDETSSR
jgi:hypothetical protein